MPEGAPARVVVLGVGSELYTDDGVGVAVARELAAASLPPEVEVVEGHVGGLDLLFDMEGADHVIIVDAVAMDRAPGEVAVFTPEEVKMLPPGTVSSLHHIGLEQVLAFAGLLGLTTRLHVVGIQPESVTPGLALTAAAAQAVPEASRRVRQLLREDGLACPEPVASAL